MDLVDNVCIGACWANTIPSIRCVDGSEWPIAKSGGWGSNWHKCGVRGGLELCPSTWPWMCKDRFCKKEKSHCDVDPTREGSRQGHGGMRPCPGLTERKHDVKYFSLILKLQLTYQNTLTDTKILNEIKKIQKAIASVYFIPTTRIHVTMDELSQGVYIVNIDCQKMDGFTANNLMDKGSSMLIQMVSKFLGVPIKIIKQPAIHVPWEIAATVAPEFDGTPVPESETSQETPVEEPEMPDDQLEPGSETSEETPEEDQFEPEPETSEETSEEEPEIPEKTSAENQLGPESKTSEETPREEPEIPEETSAEESTVTGDTIKESTLAPESTLTKSTLAPVSTITETTLAPVSRTGETIFTSVRVNSEETPTELPMMEATSASKHTVFKYKMQHIKEKMTEARDGIIV